MDLINAFKCLTDEEMEILYQRFHQEKTIKEIAADLDISPAKVSKAVHTALEKVKAKI